jgi:uncharacterized protein YbbK (DUF523 family)/uncharacterized protein YbgA (DUF1722 family)
MILGEVEQPIRIGVSACLLGHPVRFDGGHKRDLYLTGTLGRFVEFVPICPEIEIGLGVPRETLRLERRSGEIRMIGNRSGADHSDAMRAYAEQRTAELARDDLCGYVLKSNSPSCGFEHVRTVDDGRICYEGRGLFAQALIRRWPYLPVEEEGRLIDIRIRENFLQRIFAYARLRGLFKTNWTWETLAGFHSAHKLELLTHSPRSFAELAHILADSRNGDANLRENYSAAFMRALSKPATPNRHSKVLRQIAGYLSARLDCESRRELGAVIADYRLGLIPLDVPLALACRYADQFYLEELKRQSYLQPPHRELMLRLMA